VDIYFGLKPKGISRDVNGDIAILFFFCKSKSKAYRSDDSPTIVTLTMICYLKGFLNLTFPEKSLPNDPIIVVVGKSLGGIPSPVT